MFRKAFKQQDLIRPLFYPIEKLLRFSFNGDSTPGDRADAVIEQKVPIPVYRRNESPGRSSSSRISRELGGRIGCLNSVSRPRVRKGGPHCSISVTWAGQSRSA